MAVNVISIITLSVALVLDLGLEIVMTKELITDPNVNKPGYATGALVGVINIVCVFMMLLEAL